MKDENVILALYFSLGVLVGLSIMVIGLTLLAASEHDSYCVYDPYVYHDNTSAHPFCT
jgi:hypothetical protein